MDEMFPSRPHTTYSPPKWSMVPNPWMTQWTPLGQESSTQMTETDFTTSPFGESITEQPTQVVEKTTQAAASHATVAIAPIIPVNAQSSTLSPDEPTTTFFPPSNPYPEVDRWSPATPSTEETPDQTTMSAEEVTNITEPPSIEFSTPTELGSEEESTTTFSSLEETTFVGDTTSSSINKIRTEETTVESFSEQTTPVSMIEILTQETPFGPSGEQTTVNIAAETISEQTTSSSIEASGEQGSTIGIGDMKEDNTTSATIDDLSSNGEQIVTSPESSFSEQTTSTDTLGTSEEQTTTLSSKEIGAQSTSSFDLAVDQTTSNSINDLEKLSTISIPADDLFPTPFPTLIATDSFEAFSTEISPASETTESTAVIPTGDISGTFGNLSSTSNSDDFIVFQYGSTDLPPIGIVTITATISELDFPTPPANIEIEGDFPKPSGLEDKDSVNEWSGGASNLEATEVFPRPGTLEEKQESNTPLISHSKRSVLVLKLRIPDEVNLSNYDLTRNITHSLNRVVRESKKRARRRRKSRSIVENPEVTEQDQVTIDHIRRFNNTLEVEFQVKEFEEPDVYMIPVDELSGFFQFPVLSLELRETITTTLKYFFIGVGIVAFTFICTCIVFRAVIKKLSDRLLVDVSRHFKRNSSVVEDGPNAFQSIPN